MLHLFSTLEGKGLESRGMPTRSRYYAPFCMTTQRTQNGA